MNKRMHGTEVLPATTSRSSRTPLRTVLSMLTALSLAVPARAQSWERVDNPDLIPACLTLLMTDGGVMVHTPSSREWHKLIPDASGNYVHGTWRKMPSLPKGYAPLYFASAVLADGRVVVIGGEYNNGNAVWTRKGAIYDQTTGIWTNLPAPPGWANIGDAQCAVLPDGRFFLASPLDTRSAVLDPATLTWTDFGTGKTDRNDEEGWTLLPDGTVLTVDAEAAPGAERFIPSIAMWISAGSTPLTIVDAASEEVGPAVLRPDGTVFATGGNGHNAVYVPPIDLLGTGTWLPAPDFPLLNGVQQLDIADGPACLLPSGNVLCAASPGVFQSPTKFYEFDGTNLIPVPKTPRAHQISSFQGNMLVLPTGQVLFTDQSSDLEIYTPAGAPNNAWRPTITAYPTALVPGVIYVIEGTQFNGLSQACFYGDDSSNATNYPLVRLTRIDTGQVSFARTFGHSTMAVATGTTPTSTHFRVPVTLEEGFYRLEVVANGIASLPVTVMRSPRTQRSP
jgi:hypothetical protein